MVGEAGILRGTITGTTLGIATVRGGLTHPGMVPVGDSAGAGEVSMPVGAAHGMVRLGVGDIIVPVTGEDIMAAIGDIIIIILAITGHLVVRCPAVIPQEEILPADIMEQVMDDIRQAVILRPVLLL